MLLERKKYGEDQEELSRQEEAARRDASAAVVGVQNGDRALNTGTVFPNGECLIVERSSKRRIKRSCVFLSRQDRQKLLLRHVHCCCGSPKKENAGSSTQAQSSSQKERV